MTDNPPTEFGELGLPPLLLKAVTDLGYEKPSPIQAQTIPLLLSGEDIIGQAQTGTGKTAAFALPLLARLDARQQQPQILVLTPTRELAIQVAEAFQRYAANLSGFHVLPIYGGQAYDIQLKKLRRGVQVVVGTPGRIMDHLNRGTLKLDQLKSLVLDEADEMLRMGFIDDVEWILDKTPAKKQVALFSATMPPAIQKVAQRYLDNPHEIRIKSNTQTATTIRQFVLEVNNRGKLDALTRILEVNDFDAVLIFVRTKSATEDLAQKLEARGYTSVALNGDVPQKTRERTVERLKQSSIDIVVATDVAARGLDVERISHVINFDIPYDAESYVHRIGRTGRAGREGEAILFVTPRERRLLKSIESTTRKKIEPLKLPTIADVNQQRILRFKERIQQVIENQHLDPCRELVDSYLQEHDEDPLVLSAALVKLLQGDEPLLLSEGAQRKSAGPDTRSTDNARERSPRKNGEIKYSASPLQQYPEIKMLRYRLDVGKQHDVKPGNVVGAIANEAGIESQYIGAIDIYEDFTLVDLPDGMPKEILHDLKKARVCGRPLGIEQMKSNADHKRKPRTANTPAGKPKNRKRVVKSKGKPRKNRA